MSVFSKFMEYGGPWEVTNREKISSEEAKAVKRALVVTKEQNWGESISICFFMANGKIKFCPLSKKSSLVEGDEVDPKSIVFLTLSKEGEDDIHKCDGKPLEDSEDNEEEEVVEALKSKRRNR